MRIGILGNNENNCKSADSWLGIGGFVGNQCLPGASNNTCGNVAACGADNGNKNIVSIGYVFVR